LANCYSDYNIYYPEHSGFVRFSGTSYASIEELRQLTALDENSLVQDPLLKDRFQDDYKIMDGSPAIDAGIYIGPLEDMYGTKVPVGKAPDIGSCEKQLVLSDNPGRNPLAKIQEEGIVVYPNPAKGYMTIENQRSNSLFIKVELLDYSGRVLMYEEFDFFTSGSKTQLQLNTLQKGIYWLKIHYDNGNPVIKKVVVN
jgi:hypothetical protein